MLVSAGLLFSCAETLDAGHNAPAAGRRAQPGILLQDDWSADWLGEYAVLLANSGGPPLAGIIVNTSPGGGT